MSPLLLGLVLLGYALLMMLLAPALLGGSRWAVRWPRTAIAGWLFSFFSGVTAMVASLVVVVGDAIQQSCSGADPTCTAAEAAESVAIFLLGWLLSAVVGGLLSLTLYRAGELALHTRRVRRALVAQVQLAGAPRVVGGTLVHCCDSSAPVALSVPGRDRVIVISNSLYDGLSAEELRAVVEHERAHLRQRHSLLVQLAHLHRSCVPIFPSARAFERSVATLIELVADDAAVRTCGRETTAAALSAMGGLGGVEGFRLRAARLAG